MCWKTHSYDYSVSEFELPLNIYFSEKMFLIFPEVYILLSSCFCLSIYCKKPWIVCKNIFDNLKILISMPCFLLNALYGVNVVGVGYNTSFSLLQYTCTSNIIFIYYNFSNRSSQSLWFAIGPISLPCKMFWESIFSLMFNLPGTDLYAFCSQLNQ